METFIAAAETDPYLKAILNIVLEDEMSDSHPALKRFAAREAKKQKTYPEKIIVQFAMIHKPRIKQMEKEQGIKDDEEAARFYADRTVMDDMNVVCPLWTTEPTFLLQLALLFWQEKLS